MENINRLLDDNVVTAETTLVTNPHLHMIYTSNDEVLIKHSARSPFSRVVRDEGQTKLIGKLLRNFNEQTSINSLIDDGTLDAQLIDDCVDLANYLVDEGVLVNPEQDSTQVYLDTLLGYDANLSKKHIAILGSGYLGKRFAQQVVDLGIGKLTLVDERKVRNTVLEQRFFGLQPHLLEDTMPFTECVKNHFLQYGFDKVEVRNSSLHDKEALRQVFAEHDFVVLTWESLRSSIFHSVNEASIEAGKPWLLVHMDGSEAYVGPLFTPGYGPCYSEFEVQHEASALGIKDEYLTYKEALNQLQMDFTPLVLPSYMDTAAGMAAVGLLHFLASGKSFLVGRCVRYDFERLSVDFEEVLRLPRCPACAPYRPYRHPYL